MWKPLSIISGLLLLTAGALMYTQVRYPFLSERKQLEEASKNKQSAIANQAESRNARAQSDKDLEEAKAELAKNTRLKNEAQSKKDAKVQEVTETQKQKDDAAKELAEIEEKLKGLGGLERLVAELKVLQAKQQMLTTSITNTKGAIESSIAHKEATDKVIAGLKLKDLYQKTGTMVANFRSRVTEVSPELGFVVLADGNASNVTRGAKFDVRRGDSSICKIVVTHLEQNRSIAEVIPGTVAPGQSILPGDSVVVSASSTPRALVTSPAAAKPAAAKKDDSTADPDAAPATSPADPFATPGTDTATPDAVPAAAPAEAPAAEATDAPAPEAAPKEEMKPSGN